MAPIKKISQSISYFLSFDNLPIIDLRSHDDYQAGHIKSASHFPQSELINKMYQLSQKDLPLRLVGNCMQINSAYEVLKTKGYRVNAHLKWSKAVEQALQQLGLLETGVLSKRLWKPAAIIAKFVSDFPVQQNRCRALDIGAGSGRDAVYLALNGWQVSAVDYLSQALQKITQLAELNQVVVERYLLDLEQDEHILDQIIGSFDLILVIRYLHRPLLAQLQKKINPGGFLVYQTFMQGCELLGRPKKQRFLLRKGELASIFNDFTIIQDDVEYLPDGRPTNVFIARKN